MATRTDLEQKVLAELHKHSRLEAFFKTMLQERMTVTHPDWLENELVQVLLKNYTPSIDLLDGLLGNAEGQHESLLFDMSGDINGTAIGFDGALSDKLAEFNGISWLKQNGYSQITRIPPKPPDQTPDFEATARGKKHIAEVKNLRKVTDLQELTFRKLEAHRFLYPERFNKLTLDVRTTSNSGDISEIDHQNVTSLVEQVNDGRGETECKVSYKVQSRGRSIKRSVTCKWETGHSSIIGHPEGIWTNDRSRLKELRWLLRKTWRKVGDAIDQLEEYDKSDSKKLVLLNWQREPAYWFDTEAAAVFEALVDDIDKQAKRIDPHLSVVLL